MAGSATTLSWSNANNWSEGVPLLANQDIALFPGCRDFHFSSGRSRWSIDRAFQPDVQFDRIRALPRLRDSPAIPVTLASANLCGRDVWLGRARLTALIRPLLQGQSRMPPGASLILDGVVSGSRRVDVECGGGNAPLGTGQVPSLTVTAGQLDARRWRRRHADRQRKAAPLFIPAPRSQPRSIAASSNE